MGAIGNVTLQQRSSVFNKQSQEAQGMVREGTSCKESSQVFACHMSSVILTDIIQTVLETSECFLFKYTNNMQIFDSGPEY